MHDFASGGGLLGIGDFGRTPNPYDHERVSGGSSSGCAVAVATGMVDLAIGDDQGGSIRNPAHYCGVVGVKPTYGLVPHTGAVGADPSLDHLGPLSRSVRDSALTLQCIAGSDGDDPRQADCPPLTDLMTGLDGGVRGLRIGLLLEGVTTKMDCCYAWRPPSRKLWTFRDSNCRRSPPARMPQASRQARAIPHGRNAVLATHQRRCAEIERHTQEDRNADALIQCAARAGVQQDAQRRR